MSSVGPFSLRLWKFCSVFFGGCSSCGEVFLTSVFFFSLKFPSRWLAGIFRSPQKPFPSLHCITTPVLFPFRGYLLLFFRHLVCRDFGFLIPVVPVPVRGPPFHKGALYEGILFLFFLYETPPIPHFLTAFLAPLAPDFSSVFSSPLHL